MAIATKTKAKSKATVHHKKRTAAHHRQTKHYVKSYWPYLPMLAVILGGLLINSLINSRTAVLGADSNLSQTALVAATNEDRTGNDQTALTWNAQLQLAAQAKARSMVADNYWSHDTPDGKEPWSFITATGYQYQAAGENLAYGFTDADQIMNAWMRSDEHRKNLLNTSYSQVGFGVAQSNDYLGKGPQTVVVAMYGTPADSAAVAGDQTEQAPLQTVAVNRIETYAGSALSGLIVGIIGTLAVMVVLVRHGIAWRKLISRGELFIIHHPVLDTVLVGVVMAAIILSSTAGFIG